MSQPTAILMTAPGTTRDNFDGKSVKALQYEAYTKKALKTMLAICKDIREEHSLTSIAMVHRLGTVAIGEESILIAVSSPHRQAAWRAGEAALERCKEEAEIWKLEEFEDGGIWRSNRDGKPGEILNSNKQSLDSNATGPFSPKPRLERGHGPVVHKDKI